MNTFCQGYDFHKQRVKDWMEFAQTWQEKHLWVKVVCRSRFDKSLQCRLWWKIFSVVRCCCSCGLSEVWKTTNPAGVVLLCLAEITGRCLGQIDNLGYSRFLMTLHVILFPCAAAFAFIRTSAITYSTYCCLLLKKMVVAPYWWYRSRLGWHIAFSEI